MEPEAGEVNSASEEQQPSDNISEDSLELELPEPPQSGRLTIWGFFDLPPEICVVLCLIVTFLIALSLIVSGLACLTFWLVLPGRNGRY